MFACQFKKKVTPEVILIPAGYHGKVRIIFDKPCGSPESFENKSRVYIIPESGVLITKFKAEYGIINQEYYYTDVKGSRTRIPKMMLQDFSEETSTKRNDNEPSRDQIGIFQWGVTFKTEREGLDPYEGYEFFVGTYTEVRDSFSTLYGNGAYYESYYDSLELNLMKNCK